MPGSFKEALKLAFFRLEGLQNIEGLSQVGENDMPVFAPVDCYGEAVHCFDPINAELVWDALEHEFGLFVSGVIRLVIRPHIHGVVVVFGPVQVPELNEVNLVLRGGIRVRSSDCVQGQRVASHLCNQLLLSFLQND